ncbi:MAG: tRNA epoxyqueuosine(34) reductase QueG [Rhodospirillaceae bacterium]|nr:MAG: tRNA epoxyqueuosine(34) reductase QueG [Rhodospirillaceae bacterium]
MVKTPVKAALRPAVIPDREQIRARAMAAGFDAVRFTRAETSEPTRREFAAFLGEGRHGEMAWLAAHADRRADPRVLWPEARTAILLGMNYGPATDPREVLDAHDRGAISVYAQNRDYHDVIKGRLKQVASWLAAASGAEVKVFVDTAPVLEKPLAQSAGLGWQGKHTNLVSRTFGSWLFLGEIFTTLDLPTDSAEADHCGACQRCLDICPTRAFTGPYRIDARRCISYLTIEHKGAIPRELRSLMGNRIYGCDDCLAVCPWNKFAVVAGDPAFAPRDDLTAPRLADLVNLDDAAFRRLFAGSPVKRIGRDRFVRNVLIAIGNSGDSALAVHVEALLDDPAPVVRGAAVWALRRLCSDEAVAKFRMRYLAPESDADVRAEWTAVV